MKTLAAVALALTIALASVLPSYAQTTPPGGSPPFNPYGNCNPYAVPEPQLRIEPETQFIFTHESPESIVQWNDMPAASWAATAIVAAAVDTDDDGIEDSFTMLGFEGTPAAMGKCATSAHLPVIVVTALVLDPAGPSPSKMSFYTSCLSEMSGLNDQLSAYGYGQFMLGTLVCLSLLRAAANVFCLRYFPTAVGMLHTKSEEHYARNEPVAGVAYYATMTRFLSLGNNYCVAAGVI